MSLLETKELSDEVVSALKNRSEGAVMSEIMCSLGLRIALSIHGQLERIANALEKE